MNTRYPWIRSAGFAVLAAVTQITSAVAQTATAAVSPDKPADAALKLEKFVVTGSMIKRIANEGALPVEIFTRLDIEQQGIEVLGEFL